MVVKNDSLGKKIKVELSSLKKSVIEDNFTERMRNEEASEGLQNEIDNRKKNLQAL